MFGGTEPPQERVYREFRDLSHVQKVCLVLHLLNHDPDELRYLFVAILNIEQGGLTTNTILPEQFHNCFTRWVLTHELSNPP